MMGIRTPVKKTQTSPQSKSPEKTGEEAGTSNAANVEEGYRTTASPTKQSGLSKPSIKLTPTRLDQNAQSSKPTTIVPRKPQSVHSASSKVYESRTKEARSCLIKIKGQLEESRNLKKGIKATVYELLERALPPCKRSGTIYWKHKPKGKIKGKRARND